MSAGSAENRLTMTFQSTPPVENGSDNVDEESPKNDKSRTDGNGDTNMTDMGVTYPSLDGLDVADGNQPHAGGAADLSTNHPNPPTSASDSGAIPSHDGRKYNKDQRREVNRVLKCKVRDYYAILDVASVANESQIRRAYHRLCTKIHPDKNQDKDSTTAFQRVKDAYDVLSDESKRAAHDRARIAEGGRGDNDQEQGFDEEFDSNAYAESDSDDADDLDEDDDHQQESDAFRKKIFEQATPYVNKVLANRRDTETLEEIDDLNKQIRLKNQEEGLKNEKSFLVPFNVLVALGLEFSVVRSNLRKNKDDQDAWNKLEALNEQLQKLRRVNHYPQSWRLPKISGRQAEDYKDARTDPVNGADGHPTTTSKMTDTRSGTTSETTQATGSKATNSQATGSNATTSQATGSRAASSQATSSGSSLGIEASDKGEDLENRHLVPGLTKNGDKILGYRPFYQTNRRTGSTHLHGVQFVVEKRGSPNPIVLVSGAEVGNRVTDAYLGLPDSQKKDVRHSEEKYSYEDADNFEKLLGFATKAMNSLSISEPTTRYPGYGLVKFKTGEVDILSRTAFRKMLGKKDADDEIETFFPKQSQLIEPARARAQLKSHEYDSTGFTRRAPKSGNLEGLSDSESMFITEERSRGRRTTEKRLEPKNDKIKIQPVTQPQDLLAAIMARLERLDQQMLNIAEKSSGSSS